MPAPIIPWIGGKRRLAQQILPLFPPHLCYCEPFAGAAALLFAKEPSRAEVLNDINGDLVALYRVVKHHLDELVRQFRWALVSRQMFEWTRSTPPETLTEIQRAAAFFYLQKNAFGGKVCGRTFGTTTTQPPRLNLLRIEEALSAAHLRLAQVTIEHLDWASCIDRYDRATTLFYLDPPYWQTEGYGVTFGLDQYQLLAAKMRTLRGRAILSINDHPAMREAFSGLQTRRVDISYTVGGADKRTRASELIITNFKPARSRTAS